MSKTRRLSRKKLTEAQALEKISHLSMQLQNEREALMTYELHQYAPEMVSDNTMQFILAAGNHKDLQECIATTKQNIEDIKWKMYKDYGRFVSKGVHQLSSGHFISI